MHVAAGSTVLVFCDSSNRVCGLARTERFDAGAARNTIVAVDAEGVTNWMVWSGTGAFGGGDERWTFSDKAWRVDDPAHLEVAGQLGLFTFDERRVNLGLETSDSLRVEASWNRVAKSARPNAALAPSTPDRWLRRLFAAPSRAWLAWRARNGATRSITETRVVGRLKVEGRETAIDGDGWVENNAGSDIEPLIDESWTISLHVHDGSRLFVESVARGPDPRIRGALRRDGALETVSTWELEGEIPPAGKSAPISLRAKAGQAPFEWTGEVTSVVSEPVQGRGRYATRRLVRFSRNRVHAGLGSFFAREYP